MRRWMLAAAAVLFVSGVALAEATEVKLKDIKVKPKNEGGESLCGLSDDGEKIFMYVIAVATAEVEAKEDGSFKFNIELSGDMGQKDRAKFKLTIGGQEIEKAFELKQNEAKEYTFKADLKKGKHKVEIEFLNDEFKEGEYDSNFYIHKLTFEAGKKEEVKKEEVKK
jgi:hypothetical protein